MALTAPAEVKRYLQQRFGNTVDLRFRELRLGGPGGTPALLAYLGGAVDAKLLGESVLKPLMWSDLPAALPGKDLTDAVVESLAPTLEVQVEQRLHSVDRALLNEQAVLAVEGALGVIVIRAPGYPVRQVGKPETEHAVRGSREGFTESLHTNLGLVRKRVRSPNLRVTFLKVGNWSHTFVAMLHLEGLSNPAIVKTVEQRVKAIDIDAVTNSHTVESFMRDHPYTPFPTVRATERPDEVAKCLLSGKVVLLVDNSPFALSMPSVFADFYQTMEDYAFGYWGATMIRLLRVVGWATSFFLPALYVALIAVNPEMVPNELALTIAAAREGLPFPPIIEVLIIETLIELIREASLRLPQPLGTTIGVVGGVVVGQAIVAAGLISPLMIIFAAVTMIASFTAPVLEMGVPWRILKWGLVILANLFGLLGIIIGTAAVTGHLVSLSSFGTPYLSPITPLYPSGIGDTVVRAPLFTFFRRPAYLRPLDKRKLSQYQQPAEHPPLYEKQQQRNQEPEEP